MNDVKSARRVLEILRFFSEEKAPASLARLSAALGYPKSSCLALMDTLVAEGYAYPLDGRYYLTGRWLREAQAVSAHDRLAEHFRPTLEHLQRELQETVILAQLAGDRVVYLDALEADRVLRFSAHAGQFKPVHASASGRALLAALPPDEAARMAARLHYERYTPATPRDAKALLRQVEEGRARGWHLNLGEHQRDTVSIAVPVRFHGAVVALVVGAPMSRLEGRTGTVGKALMRAAAEWNVSETPQE